MKQKTRRLPEVLVALIVAAAVALLFAFPASVLFTSRVYAQTAPAGEGLYRSSVYRRVIRQGSASLSCYLSYPQGGSLVLRGYGNNSYELGKLGEFIRSALSDTLIYVRGVRVCGYSSVDGSYSSNEQLARKRSLGFRQFILSEYPFLKQYDITPHWVGEDWDKLRSLVERSHIGERNEILLIIDKIGVFSGREKLLMDLSGGAPYLTMEQLFFPLLRRVELTVEYDLQRIMEERYHRKLSEEEFNRLLEEERQKARREEKDELLHARQQEDTLAQESALTEQREADSTLRERALNERYKALEEAGRSQKESVKEPAKETIKEPPVIKQTRFKPLWGFKTNLYALAGMTTEGKHTTLMPNLEVEYFAFGRWSVAVSALYSYRNFGQQEFWGVSSYTLEPRFRFGASERYRGFYTGVYARLGDFDIRRDVVENVTTDNRTGTYYEAGASLGYVLALSRHWYLEAGVSGGYRGVKNKVYEVEQGKHYFVRDESENRLRLTDIRLSIAYRLGRKMSK
jgi:hypothetical protein